MKRNEVSNYISKFAISFAVILIYVLSAFSVSAQIMSYGGVQYMYWGTEVCSNSSTNVHFILSEGNFVSLADEGTELHGDSNVEFGVSQVGTYEEIPIECIMAGSPPVLLWVTQGTYIDASTGYSMREKFFAGAVNPFIKKVNLNTNA